VRSKPRRKVVAQPVSRVDEAMLAQLDGLWEEEEGEGVLSRL
jgi:hypothetical protein